MKINVIYPGQLIPDTYFDCRYRILREPLGFNPGDERLLDDEGAIHVWIQEGKDVIAVGRAHLISQENNGEQVDHEGDGAAICPSFAPLDGVDGFPQPTDLRPAFQIRQMGVDKNHRRKGLGRIILETLEDEIVGKWSTQSGWLQARKVAIPFYTAAGWIGFGDYYDIFRIGQHQSMWKKFSSSQT